MSEAAAYVLRYGPATLIDGTATTRASRVESAWCEWNGRRFDARSSHGALCKLARVLVAAGAPDGAWRSMTMAGTPSMTGPSLHDLARWTIAESNRQGIRMARFQERPDFRAGNGKEAGAAAEGYADTLGAPDRPGILARVPGIGMSEAEAA